MELVSFALLGDSITNGNASGVVPDNSAFYVSYRKPLWDRLKAAGYVVDDDVFVGSLITGDAVADFDPDHDGQRGWRADEINLPTLGKDRDPTVVAPAEVEL